MTDEPKPYVPQKGERVIMRKITWNDLVAEETCIWHSVEPAPPDPEDKPQE